MGAFLTYALNKNRETSLELSLQRGLSFFSGSHFLFIGFTRLPSTVLGATKNLTVAKDFCGDASNGVFESSFLKLTLPHDNDIPSFGFQLPPDFLVTRLVAGDLGCPKVRICLGDRVKLTVSVAMPETAVDKDDCSVLGKDNIGGAGKSLVIHLVTEALSPKCRTQPDLRFRGSGANGSHVSMALYWSMAISHLQRNIRYFPEIQ